MTFNPYRWFKANFVKPLRGEQPHGYDIRLIPPRSGRDPARSPQAAKPTPRYILELFPSARIAVTQPRRMAAVNLAKRVAKAWIGEDSLAPDPIHLRFSVSSYTPEI